MILLPFGLGQLGTLILVLDLAHARMMFSARSYGWVGSVWSAFGAVCSSPSLLASDFVHCFSSLVLQSFTHLEAPLFVLNTVHTESFLLLRSMGQSSAPALASGMSCSSVSLAVIDCGHAETLLLSRSLCYSGMSLFFLDAVACGALLTVQGHAQSILFLSIPGFSTADSFSSSRSPTRTRLLPIVFGCACLDVMPLALDRVHSGSPLPFQALARLGTTLSAWGMARSRPSCAILDSTCTGAASFLQRFTCLRPSPMICGLSWTSLSLLMLNFAQISSSVMTQSFV